MPLTEGDKLGPYEIISLIGKGGMGEVYMARDPRLGRDVAIKVSAAQFTERFEREARVIASLNHPNICHLYDVGPNYLVMELVEGPTLGEQIKQGAIPVEEVLTVARQIADALEAAHEKGITHRDLKPGNIKIRPDGVVKVLDFGLAKIGGTPTAQSDYSPTITIGQTEAGVILGTAAYMSPEQAKGKPVDQRADIYAFGVVLYEMVTGQRLHHGETTTEILASVIKEEPQWDKVPAQLRRLLRRCLEKDPQKRLRHIGDVMSLVDDAPPALAPAAVLQAPARQDRWLWPAAAGLLAVFSAGLIWMILRSPAPVAHSIRFQVPLPEKGAFGFYVALSPDGRKLAFNTAGPEGGLWVQDLDSLEAKLLPGTQGALGPFWSPDSRSLAFGVRNVLKRIDVSGGPPQTLCEAPTPIGSGAWNREGVIIFGGRGRGPIRRIPAAGGVVADVTAVDASRNEAFHSLPTFLPDGKHFVYFRGGAAEVQGIYAGSLDAKPQDQTRERLVEAQFGGVYAPDRLGGHLFFLQADTLMAQPFDPARRALTGELVPVAEKVGASGSSGFFSISDSGALAYRTGGFEDNRQLAWFDRQGNQIEMVGEPGPYSRLTISPDGRHAAMFRRGAAPQVGDIWLYDFERRFGSRFTFDQRAGGFESELGATAAVWSPDGDRIAFSSRQNGVLDLYEKPSNGTRDGAVLLKSGLAKSVQDWSHDGRFILYAETDPKGFTALMVLPLEGSERKPIPFLTTPFNETGGKFSPDMRWIAFTSLESGRSEIYVAPFRLPGSGAEPAAGKVQVSTAGGSRPKWRADGKELFFHALDDSPMAAEVMSGSTLQAGLPHRLFSRPYPGGSWDVTADGKLFLVSMPPQQQQNAQSPITVVLNWEAGLKK